MTICSSGTRYFTFISLIHTDQTTKFSAISRFRSNTWSQGVKQFYLLYNAQLKPLPSIFFSLKLTGSAFDLHQVNHFSLCSTVAAYLQLYYFFRSYIKRSVWNTALRQSPYWRSNFSCIINNDSAWHNGAFMHDMAKLKLKKKKSKRHDYLPLSGHRGNLSQKIRKLDK